MDAKLVRQAAHSGWHLDRKTVVNVVALFSFAAMAVLGIRNAITGNGEDVSGSGVTPISAPHPGKDQFSKVISIPTATEQAPWVNSIQTVRIPGP